MTLLLPAYCQSTLELNEKRERLRVFMHRQREERQQLHSATLRLSMPEDDELDWYGFLDALEEKTDRTFNRIVEMQFQIVQAKTQLTFDFIS